MDCPACHHPNIEGARFCAKCGAPLPASATAEQDPLIGAIVGGRFRVTGILGEGGMGRVYTGEQQMGTSVRRVAIKTLLSQFAKDPQTVARFMRECGTVSELEHPNTIKVYDFGQTNTGELYIAMELLQGSSLEDAVHKSAPLAAERVDKILAQACGSLQEAHDKGIVHRDLKPANIYLTTRAGEEDYVKVLDFGIAKRSEAKDAKQEAKLTQQGTILGTPPYMSPEQFMGKELDPRSDIYSLGVLAYEMLTGRLPFEADTPWQWATQHMTAQPFPFETIPMAAHVPPKMRAAVMKALSKDREKRQQTARDFYEDISLGVVRSSMLGFAPGRATSVPDASHASFASGATEVNPSFPQGYSGAVEPYTQQQPAHGVPTGGGQAMPAPAREQKKSGGSAGIIVALVLLVGIGGAAGWWFGIRKSGVEPEDDYKPTTFPSATASKNTDENTGKDTDDETETKASSTSSSDTGTGSATAQATETASASATGSDTSSGTQTTVATDTGTATASTGSAIASNTNTSTATKTMTATKTQTETKVSSGGSVDGCCAALSAKRAAATNDADKKKYGAAAGKCQALRGKVASGDVDRGSALSQIKAKLGGLPAPGGC